MVSYGIIGFPLKHSFSKKYFTEKIEHLGISEAVYHSFPISTIDKFPELLKNNPFLKGLSVTIPYKEKVLPYITYLSPEVKEIGATNCIKISGNQLKAFNTDIIGFEESFTKHLKPVHKKALILGTGGASKAVQFVFKKLGIEFLLVSRQKQDQNNCILYSEIDDEIINTHNIIINTTPLGMSPDENLCPEIPYDTLTSTHYLYDLVYNPAKTLFLSKGEAKNAIICNGYEMLIIQAEANWKIWNED